MSTAVQPKRGGRVCQVALLFFTANSIYVLSFGPAVTLSTPVKYAGYDRPARFPALANAVNVVYRPLFGVLGGHAGRVPRNSLTWYVHLWDYGVPPWEKESKEVQASLNQAIEELRKKKMQETH
jgi:hypothetical protein